MNRILKSGRWIFASMFAVFGLLHFGPLEFSMPHVPGYLPSRTFRIYSSGAGPIVSAVSARIGILDKSAAVLLALMMFLFVLMKVWWWNTFSSKTICFYGIMDQLKADKGLFQQQLNELAQRINEGKIKPIVTNFPLEKIKDAHGLLESGVLKGHISINFKTNGG